MNNSSLIKFISCFNNGQANNLEKVTLPLSKDLSTVLDLLSINGLIIGSSSSGTLCHVFLKRDARKNLMRARLISKPSRKIHMSYREIENNFYNADFVLISSNLGLITAKEAVLLKIGGEVVMSVQ